MCGIKPFHTPGSNPDGVDVDLRCLDVQPRSIAIVPVDGRNRERDAHTLAHKSAALQEREAEVFTDALRANAMRHALPARFVLALAVGTLGACAQAPSLGTVVLAERQVRAAEIAFAASMAERDLDRFASFVADDAVFFSGPSPLRGKEQVVAFWSRWFEDEPAPFSWAPDQVEVLAAGTLALTSGPVHDAGGTLIGRFTSVWRREGSGTWRVVFDKGDPVCPDAAPRGRVDRPDRAPR